MVDVGGTSVDFDDDNIMVGGEFSTSSVIGSTGIVLLLLPVEATLLVFVIIVGIVAVVGS